MYRHPSSDISTFEEAYLSVIEKMKTNQKFIVVGDFNINYDQLEAAPSMVANYINSINMLGCVQFINKPTRITKTSSTIIDHVYANQNLVNSIYPAVMIHDISDHLPIIVEYRTANMKKETFRPLIRQLPDEKVENFLIDLNDALQLPDFRSNTKISSLLNLLISLTNFHFPKKRLTRKQYKISKNPWITKDILAMVKSKNKLYNQFLKTKNHVIHAQYKKCRNNLTHIKEQAKRNYYKSIFNGCDTSGAWANINQILKKNRKNSASLPTTLNCDGLLLEDPIDISNAFNDYFANIGNKIAAMASNSNYEQEHKPFQKIGNVIQLY